MFSSREYPYPLSPTEEIGNARGVLIGQKIIIIKESMKLNNGILRGVGGGGIREHPFHVGGMDIFWNCKLQIDSDLIRFEALSAVIIIYYFL